MEISPGPLVARRIVVPQPSHPEGFDRGIAVWNCLFRMVGVVIRVKVRAVNCIGHNSPPWRGGTRTNKTEP